MSLVIQSKNQRQEHWIEINSLANDSENQQVSLRSAIVWANDMETRLNDAIQNSITEFCQRKAAWGLKVSPNERPHVITDQVAKASRYKVSAYVSLVIETLIAAYTLSPALAVYLHPPVRSFIGATIVSGVLTFGLAFAIHGALLSLFDHAQKPLDGFKRLKSIVILPTLILMLVSVAGYGAIRTLDASTLLWAQSVISLAIYLAIFGFWGLGTGLLVAVDVYDWSVAAATAREDLENELQAVRNSRREWQEQLNRLSGEDENPLTPPNQNPPITPAWTTQQPTVAALPANTPVETQTAQETVITSNASSNGLKAAAVTAMMGLSLLAGACNEYQVRKTPVTEKVVVSLNIDVSGLEDNAALHQAGQHIRQDLPGILEKNCVTDLHVYWFGANGWKAEEKFKDSIPPCNKIEVVFPEPKGEIGAMRPDILEEQNKRRKAITEIYEKQEDEERRFKINQLLSRLSDDVLKPSSDIKSPITDINGLLARFSRPLSVTKHIVIVATDGEENTDKNGNIHKITLPGNTTIIIIIVAVDKTDFEVKSKKFNDACPSCSIFPHYSDDLGGLIDRSTNDNHASIQ